MIRLLDGSRDREAILATMAKWAAEGYFEISSGGQPVQDETQLRKALCACLDESLLNLVKNALLVG